MYLLPWEHYVFAWLLPDYKSYKPRGFTCDWQCEMWKTDNLQNLSNSTFQVIISMEIFFPTTFDGILPRWICKINSIQDQVSSSLVRVSACPTYLLCCTAKQFSPTARVHAVCPFGLLHNLTQLRINLPHLSFLPGFDICLFWTLHILPPRPESHAFAWQHHYLWLVKVLQ